MEKSRCVSIGKVQFDQGARTFLDHSFIDQLKTIDMRVLAMDIPAQQVITKDNVPVKINGVLFFKVTSAADAIIKVQDYVLPISQYSQTSLRDALSAR